MYSIQIQPYYNSIRQCYTHIYTIDPEPASSETALLSIICKINPPKLSPFQTNCCSDHKPSCINAIYNPTNINMLLAVGEESLLFNYLIKNNYTINTSITKIMKEAPVKTEGSKLLCIISK